MLILNHWRMELARVSWPVWLCAVLVSVAVLVLRLYWSFEFPVVWPDETHFIAQSFELYRNSTLYVWGMNAERSVMWMPPGYFVLLATVYKLFGYSYEISRWVSAAMYLGGFSMCLAIVSRAYVGWRQWLALFLLALTFVAPYTLVMANIARMDAFYTFVFLLSMVFAIRGLPALGLALVLGGSIIHFNAVYFLLPYAVLVGWKIVRREAWQVSAFELLALVFAILVLARYGLYVLANIGGFMEDMRFQFNFKGIQNPMGGPKGWLLLGALLGIALLQLLAHRRFTTSVWLTLYGVGFYALALNGKAMWYAFAYNLGLCLMLLGVLLSSERLQSRIWKSIAGVGFIGLLYLFATHLNHGEQGIDKLKPTWTNAAVPLVADGELDRIRQQLSELPEGGRVSFGLNGMEPFFFKELADSGLKWSMPGTNVIQPMPPRELDYRVFCDSVWFPDFLRFYDWDGYPRKGENSGCRLMKVNLDNENAQ